jgi:hypothetical protein
VQDFECFEAAESQTARPEDAAITAGTDLLENLCASKLGA